MKNCGGVRVGIIGGGQLARMMVPPAHRLGWEVLVLESRADCPAVLAGAGERVGDWRDPDVVARFSAEVEVVTLDHEFVPWRVLPRDKTFPKPECLAVIQDKLVQKQRLAEAGLPVAASRALDSAERIEAFPAVVKARRNAYDGKGNWLVQNPREAAEVFAEGLYVEEFVEFERELAVMAVRGRDGQVVLYPVVETVQKDHICHEVRFPAPVSPEVAGRAGELARQAAVALDCVGALGVEMFLLPGGGLMVNELAPRPHNSGHYSIEACHTSQFENHLRAVCGMPLGDPSPKVGAAVMVNLLAEGEGSGQAGGLAAALEIPGVAMHLYGKKGAKAGRKMGHLTVVGDRLEEVEAKALQAASCIRFKGV